MTHLVQLTNENDEYVGLKMRDELVPTDIARSISVNIIDPSGKKVLIQKRSAKKWRNPGLWVNAVSGALESGESYETAALREISEEIGVIGYPLTKLGVKLSRNPAYCGWNTMRFSMCLPPDTVFTLQKSEVDEVRWIWINELREWTDKTPEDFTRSSLAFWKELWIL